MRERCGPVKASARRRPALICGAVEVPDIITATSPATVAVVAGAPPLYGTWIMSIPARFQALHGEMVLAAVAARGVLQRRVGAARVFDELREGLHRNRRI